MPSGLGILGSAALIAAGAAVAFELDRRLVRRWREWRSRRKGGTEPWQSP